jgi:hypothetical protein
MSKVSQLVQAEQNQVSNAQALDSAAETASSLVGLAQSLCRFAYLAQNEKDFEAFHALMWDLLPGIGARLDSLSTNLGGTPSGAFANGTMKGMFAE